MAASNELTKVTGCLVVRNSRDLPATYSFNDPFGFDEGNSIPIFKYSLNELIDAFYDPVTLNRAGINDASKLPMLIAESQENTGLKTVDLFSLDWENIIKLLEWVFANQTLILTTTDWPGKEDGTYSSFPDYIFRNLTLDTGYFPNADEIKNYVSTYVAKSFNFVQSTKQNRLSFIEFRCKVNDIPKDFKVYLDVDDFMDFYSGNQFFVYYYRDTDGNEQISQTEFDKQIIDAINAGTMKRTWRTMKTLVTPYCEPYYDGDTYKHKNPVNRTFYVYSNLPAEEFTIGIITEEVIKKIIEDNGGTEDDLPNQYPNLFSDQEVHIYPVHDNIAINKNEGNTLQIVHPISYNKIQDVMKLAGLPIVSTADTFRNVEIFNVGIDVPEAQTLNKFIYPLLAADYSADKTKLPITSRFINYSPRSFADFDGTGSNDDKFQFILIQILSYFSKMIEKEALIQNLQPIDQNLNLQVVEATESEYARVKFNFVNTLFSVIWYTGVDIPEPTPELQPTQLSLGKTQTNITVPNIEEITVTTDASDFSVTVDKDNICTVEKIPGSTLKFKITAVSEGTAVVTVNATASGKQKTTVKLTVNVTNAA